MSRKQTLILFTTVLQILSSKSAVVNKPPVKTPEFGDCGGAFRMNYRFPTLSIGTARSGQYAHGQDCLWTIIGAPSCITQITCPQIDMRNDCENEYVYISDGVGGDLTLCGNINNFTSPLRASKGVRDLYINFVSSENTKFDRLYTGFRCDLSCVPNNNSKAVGELQPDGIQLKEDPTCMCGMLNNDASQRIVGGENANKEEFPWVAALVKAGTRQPFCGSSILNNKWVLTAAHCFFFKADINVAEFEVLTNAFVLDMKVNKGANYNAEFGQTGSVKSPGWDNKKVTDKDEKSLRFQVEEVIMHPLMNKDYDFDVALIRVKGIIPMKGKHEVLPICLPPIGYFTSFDTKRAVVSGWGLAKHDAGASTRVLQKLVVPIIPHLQCQKMLPTSFVLSARQMCAGYQKGGKDSCKGDSGGPLSLMPLADKFRTQQQTVVGIVSVGFKCALPNRPGIYTRVTEVNQWIQYRTRQTTDAVWCKSNI